MSPRIVIGLLAFCVILGECQAKFHSVKDHDYYRMPPLYGLDDYNQCMVEPGAQYCLVDVAVYSDKYSELDHYIKEYSSNMLHFNHSEIHRGICVNKSCKRFLDKNINGKTKDLNATLGECLNQTLWEEYQLQGKLVNVDHCINESEETNTKLDVGDIAMVVICVFIVLLNLIGTSYDFWCGDKDTSGNIVLAFSLPRNWKRLISRNVNEEQRSVNLRAFNGLRTIIMAGTLVTHMCFNTICSYISNPQSLEELYEAPFAQVLQNGALSMNTFFVMSAFLLAYQFQLQAETTPISWWLLPTGMLRRLMRLLPMYGLVLGATATWARHFGSGPLWRHAMGHEIAECRQQWWMHALFINNYVGGHLCMPHTWYVAADTQLFFVGLVLCIAARSPRAQKVSLLLLFALGLMATALQTYWFDLDAVTFNHPEFLRSYAMFRDATFRVLYAPGHSNMATYSLGLAAGFGVYYWQKEGKNLDQYRKYKWVYWSVVPCGLGVILSGALFYNTETRTPLYVRVLYATLAKPVFQLLVVVFIVGCVFRFEALYRPIVEWPGWRLHGRLTYIVYITHMLIQKAYIGNHIAPAYFTVYRFVIVNIGLLQFTYCIAVFLWLAVDAPVAQLVKTVMAPGRHLENKMAAESTEELKGDVALTPLGLANISIN